VLGIAALAVLVVIGAVTAVVPPLLFKRIVDDGILGGDASLVTMLALAAAGIAILEACLAVTVRVVSARVGEGLVYTMRTRLYAHVQRMPLAFFTQSQTGALVSRVDNDVRGAQRALTGTLAGGMSNLVSVALVTGTMLSLSRQITLAGLLLVPLLIYPAKRVGRRLRALAWELMQRDAEMTGRMTERFNVSGALLVKLLGRPEDEDAQFAATAGRLRDLGIRVATSSGLFFASLGLVASLGTAAVYLVGGHLAIQGHLTVGTLLALTALLTRLYGPATGLANLRIETMTAFVSFERVFEVLDLRPMVSERPAAVPLPRDAASIEFDRVCFRYPTSSEVSLASLAPGTARSTSSPEVLHEVTFDVRPGQLVALVGRSGAGKTTIAHLVARLYDVTGGAVRIGGHDVRNVALASLSAVVGVVPQDAHMFHTSIRANLLYARPDAGETDMIEACRAAQAWNFVVSLPDGLDTVVGDRGHRLSGGEKQRLALARLVLQAPSIAVLDEATAHLDAESEQAVRRALRIVLAGRTSLVIAHRLSTVSEADQILVVDDGRIVERGRHDQLITAAGPYSELCRTQLRAQARVEPASRPASSSVFSEGVRA
jgi:ATP-binding cassette, subfamily B, bacterial